MRRSRAGGFTLVELMVTIAIVAILLAVALPNFRDTIQSNRMATYGNALLASISIARSEAMRSTHGAQICAANATFTNCNNATLDWGTSGWIVWVNNNVTSGIQAGDTVVRVMQPDPDVLLTVSAGAAPGATEIAFDNRGRPLGNARTFTMKPTACTVGRQHLRTLAMNASGQIKTSKGACP